MRTFFYNILSYALFFPLQIGVLLLWLSFKATQPLLSLSLEKKYIKWVFNTWATLVLKLTGTDIKIIGQNNLSDQNTVFISNHQSMLDIPCVIKTIKQNFSFIAKSKYKKFPIISTWFKTAGGVFFSQTRTKEEFKRIQKVIKRLKEGDNFVIFPEGTRSKTGKINEFKTAPFKIAKKAHSNINIITIVGTREVLPKGRHTVKPSKVFVIINPPLEWEDYKDWEVERIINFTKKKLIQQINHFRKYIDGKKWDPEIEEEFFNNEQGDSTFLSKNNNYSQILAEGCG